MRFIVTELPKDRPDLEALAQHPNGDKFIDIDSVHELLSFIRRTGHNCIVKPAGLDDRMDGTNRADEIEIYWRYRE